MHKHKSSSVAGGRCGGEAGSVPLVFAPFLTSHTCVARTTQSLPLADSFAAHFFQQEALKNTQSTLMISIKQKGSLQASAHQLCSCISERSDCQQQDPYSASMTLKKEKHFFLLQSRDLRHFHRRTKGAERENGTTKFRIEYRLQMHNMNWTVRNKIGTTLPNQEAANDPGSLLSADLHKVWKRTSEKQYDVIFPCICLVLNLFICYCTVSTCSHLGQNRNIKKTLDKKLSGQVAKRYQAAGSTCAQRLLCTKSDGSELISLLL